MAARRTAPIWSIGLRPFFLGATLFATLAVPVWLLLLLMSGDAAGLAAARAWHTHEMIFGFLPAVIAGFLFTAIPNWTDRPPVSGGLLKALFLLWAAGRVAMALPMVPAFAAALADASFLLAVAAVVWREIITGAAWRQAPIAVLISLYAFAAGWFHVLRLTHHDAAQSERLALGCLMLLLTIIGGRVTPAFTAEWLREEEQPTPTAVDAATIGATAAAAGFWSISPDGMLTGLLLVTAGIAHLTRWIAWRGWRTWREPLVLVLHVGYGWITAAFWLLGTAIMGVGLPVVDALHALTAGAVGVMTLAIMTRASLGHTGRVRHAGRGTVAIYGLVTLGALLRVFGPSVPIEERIVLALAALCWSGAYAGFCLLYGPFLLRPSLDE